MLIKQLFESDVSYIPNDVFEQIRNSQFFKNNYENWLHDSKRDVDDDPIRKLYRGMDMNKPVTVIKPYKKRRPLDTIIQYHAFTNSKSEEVLGIKVRDLIFSRVYPGPVKDYGNPYLLFPLGDYTLYYNEKVRDFTTYYDAHIKLSTMVMRAMSELFGDFKAYTPVKADVELLVDGLLVEDHVSFRKTINNNLSKVADIIYASAEKTYDDLNITKEKLYKTISRNINSRLDALEKYITGMKTTKIVKDIDDVEVMIDASEIIAIDIRLEYEFFIEMTKRYRGK
jgi:hypothetical protein